MMRVVTLRNYGLRVTQASLPKHFHRAYSTSPSRMAEQWNAVKVRKTFIDFFKDNGHKFGRYIK